MKRLILFIAVLSICLGASAQTISVKASGESLQTVIKSISAQSDYKFAFNSRSIDTSVKINTDVTSSNIEEILNSVLKDTGIGYSIVGKQIALFTKQAGEQPLTATQAKSRKVTGVVTDEDGIPLEGAGIMIAGTKTGTVSNQDGHWALEVPGGDVIFEVSYIGMETINIPVGTRDNVVVVMKPNYELINQVVVTGYQTLSRERSSGSYAIVSGAEVKNRSAATGSPLRSLEGTVAGLNVNESAEGTSYLIRGMTSINSKTEPLFIVDGVPMDRKLLEKMVNPSDIESVTFLKDATAASIWGAQAANGVVVFSTKSGESSKKISVSYDGSFTWRGLPDYSYMDYMGPEQFIATAKEVFDPFTYKWEDITSTTYGSSANYPIVFPHEELLYKYYRGEISLAERDADLDALASQSWRDSYERYFMSRSFLTNHSVSLSGGSDVNSFYFSMDYQGDLGSHRDKSDQFKAYIRDRMLIGDWLTLDASLNALYSKETSHLSAADEFSTYATDLPYAAFADASGNFYDMSGFFLNKDDIKSVNEVSGIDLSYYPVSDYAKCTSRSDLYAIRANLGISIDFTSWLTYEGRFQYSASNNTSESYYPYDSFQVRIERAYGTDTDGTQHLPSSGGHFTDGHSLATSYTIRNQLSLNKTFGTEHSLRALAGMELNSNKTGSKSTFLRGYDMQTMQYIPYDQFFLSTTGVKPPLLPQISGSSANVFDPNNFTQTEIEYRFMSVYANAGYTFKEKYSLNASIRVDQSNLFGSDPSVQFKPIWSAGAIWNMHKESFMKEINWIDRLNIRLSYGLAGNSPDPGQGGPYNLIQSQTDPAYSRFGLGYTIITPANDKLTWEKTRTINAGVDFTAFEGRLDMALDVYDKYTTNLLTSVPVDPTTGFTTVLSNIGEMSNRGFELSINGNLVRSHNFSWDAFLNLTYNRNRLEKMYITPPGTPSALLGYDYWEGYPYGTIFGYRWAGLDPANGRSRVYDQDGAIVNQAADVKDASAVPYLGTTIPPWFGSLGTSLTWGRLSLSCLFVYNMGHVLRNDVNSQYTYRLTHFLHNDFASRWKVPGDEAKTDIPAYYSLADTTVNENDVAGLYKYADINVLSASYLKLREVSLNYRLPEKWASKIYTRGISLGAQVTNLMTLAANGQGIDPEAFSLSAGARSERFRPVVTFNANIEF
ncbi:MAG: SusC/RagA family TonB-linked outer membrane protein [Bacteroidales bacterium]|nr:SusC/RagA family TonB-linked outer membrane protein [Bacteroidales bacterium]